MQWNALVVYGIIQIAGQPYLMTDICIDQKNRFYTVQALDDLVLIKLTGQLHLMMDINQ